jgi:hypothetical protein
MQTKLSYEDMASDDSILLSAADATKLVGEHGIDDISILIADEGPFAFNGHTYEIPAPVVMRWLGY